MKSFQVRKAGGLALVALVLSVGALVAAKPHPEIGFSSLEEQVNYCAWKYGQYCEDWEHGAGFHPGLPPSGGFRGYAPECYQGGLELSDSLEICLAYQRYEE